MPCNSWPHAEPKAFQWAFLHAFSAEARVQDPTIEKHVMSFGHALIPTYGAPVNDVVMGFADFVEDAVVDEGSSHVSDVGIMQLNAQTLRSIDKQTSFESQLHKRETLFAGMQ